jgi:hypothetical protein
VEVNYFAAAIFEPAQQKEEQAIGQAINEYLKRRYKFKQEEK